MSDEKRIAVGLIWSDGRLVVGRRPKETVLAGYDELPGGKCEPDESPDRTVVRECLEETGLRVTVLGRRLELEHTYPHDRVHLYFFDCELQSRSLRSRSLRSRSDSPKPKEPFRWIEVEEIFRLRMPEANAPLLASLRETPGPVVK